MKVAVVGARGHIGSFLVSKLVRDGHEVCAVSRSDRKPYAYDPKIWDKVNSFFMSREELIASDFFDTVKADAVCDLVSFNVGECEAMIEKLTHGEFYVQIGSIWTYENKKYLPVDENHPKNSVEEYGKNKGIIEEYIKSLVKSGKLCGAVVHPGHISSGEWMPINPQGNLDKDVFMKIRDGQEVVLPFLGLATLHHVHSADLANVIAACAENHDKANGEAFISVAPTAMTMRAITEELFEYFGHKPNIRYVSWKDFVAEVGEQNAAVSMDHISHSPCCTAAKAEKVLGVRHEKTIMDIYKEYLNGAFLR